MPFYNLNRVLLAFLLVTCLIGTVNAATFINYTVNASDGYAGRAVHNATWATLHDTETGTESASSDAYQDTRVYSDLQTDTYWSIYRGVLIFDTSGLPDDCTITSAKVGLWRRSTSVGVGDTGVSLTKFTIDGTISNDDYNNFNNDLFSPYQNISTMGTNKYYNWSLNALGISNISKTGNSGFGSRLQFDIDNVTPTWASYTYSRLSWYAANNMANTPFIEIEYTVPTPTPTPAPVSFSDWAWCGKQDIFFRNDSSDITGYFHMDHRPQIEDTKYLATTVSSGTGSKRIGSWATNASIPGVSVIGPGLWRFRVYLNVSSAVGDTNYEFKIYNRSSDGTETDLFYGHVISKDINDLTPTEHLISYARRNYTTLFSGDRLVIKVNASTSSVAARDAYIWIAGNNQASMVESGYYLCPDEYSGSDGGSSMIVESPAFPGIAVMAMAIAAIAAVMIRRKEGR